MSLKGGYKILDLSTNPSYDEIAKVLNTEKVILVSGLVVDDVKQKDCFASVEENEGVYTLKTPDRVIVISETEGITTNQNVLMNNIVDKNGNLRFIEGEGEINTSLPEGVHISYKKWSLSGSHLMFVVAGTLDNTTTLDNITFVYFKNIPSWILDKIYPVWANIYIENKSINATADNFTTQELSFILYKNLNQITVRTLSNITLTADRGFRIAFDLLIDNE